MTDQLSTQVELDDLPVMGTLFAPTGTYADAIEARVLMRAAVENPTVMNSSLAVLKEAVQANRPWDEREAQEALMGWVWSVKGDGPTIYINPDMIEPILESSRSMPELPSIAELPLPPSGVVVFGREVADIQYTQALPMMKDVVLPMVTESPLRITALSWFTRPHDGLLSVTPWVWFGSFPHEQLGIGQFIFPVVPAWLDGEAPRAEALDARGNPYGWNSPANHFIRFLVATAYWMQDVAEVSKEKPARPTRRRWERTGRKDSDVTVVKFRKPPQHPWDPDAAEHKGREYSHRWIVSAHWHTYRVGPGRTQERLVLVPPYIKGPPDKPLRAKSKIWKVDR